MTLADRIRSDIETRIHSGEWQPGDRVPFEHELVATYGCARATVSKALEALAQAGLIERRRKAGSFVAHPQVQSAVLEVPDLAEVIAARGERYRWALARRVEAASDGAIPAPCLHITGTHFSGDVPFGYEERAISLAAVPDAANESFTATAPGTWLLRHVAWTQARHRIAAVEASAGVAARLGVRTGAACLELERWTWRAGEVVTHVRQLFPGHRYDLVAEFRPSSTAGSAGTISA